MNKDNLKIYLFGEGIIIQKICLDDKQYKDMDQLSGKLNQPLLLSLTDPYFFHQLKDYKIKSIEDIAHNVLGGLMNTLKNQIEIWFRGRKLLKLNLRDLMDEYLLFPLYRTSTSKIDKKYKHGIYIKSVEIGRIGSYTTHTEHFSLEKLHFYLTVYDSHLVLTGLSYDGSALKLSRKDTLLISQNAYEIY